MIVIEQQKGETRKDYLVRLAIEVLRDQAGYDSCPTIFYDEAECDAYCLADDLAIEFGIDY